MRMLRCKYYVRNSAQSRGLEQVILSAARLQAQLRYAVVFLQMQPLQAFGDSADSKCAAMCNTVSSWHVGIPIALCTALPQAMTSVTQSLTLSARFESNDSPGMRRH